MDVKSMVDSMFPFWIMGLIMLYLVKNSEYANLLRIDKKGLFKFGRFLTILTVIRVVYLKFIAPPSSLEGIKNISDLIPWQTLFGVFWEDACHALPLVLLGLAFSDQKWFKILRWPLLAIVALSFGSAHEYEGFMAMVVLTCYIPVTMSLGKKYGFGTVMICHVLYDLITFLSFKLILSL